MKTIAHISDLHFGRSTAPVEEALLRDVQAHAPALVAVSGDLTQRARTVEFQAARRFLDALAAPVLVVPGNHDIPLWNVARRFLTPLSRYQRYISCELSPAFQDDDVCVLGVNTARSFALSHGRISRAQIDDLDQRFGAAAHAAVKVVVTHHPFLPPRRRPGMALVGRAPLALRALSTCGVDLLLAGHMHLAFNDEVARHHAFVARSIVVAQAGTALSTRTRGEPNAYNLIHLQPGHLAIEVRVYRGTAFQTQDVSTWRQREGRWTLAAAA